MSTKRRINITITEELYNDLKTSSNINCRSLSQEIEYRLQQSIPHNTPGGLQTAPIPPYKITCQAETGEVAAPTPAPAPAPETGEAVAPTMSEQSEPVKISKGYTDIIDEYERNMGDPGNENYQKIKKYFTYTDPNPEAFIDILQLADENNFPAIARDYEYSIKKALDIPPTYELMRSDWKEIVGYFR